MNFSELRRLLPLNDRTRRNFMAIGLTAHNRLDSWDLDPIPDGDRLRHGLDFQVNDLMRLVI